MLMVFRVFQGIGFGGEWGVGAILVAELIARGARQGARRDPERVGGRLGAGRGRLPDRLLAGRETSRVAHPDVLGILPALLILYVRRNVEDPEVFREEGEGARASCR